jgi:NADP-dependent 3-hydroxy acid dehydrogenase YdfG
MCEKCKEKLEMSKTAWSGGLPRAIVVVTGAKINEAKIIFKKGIPATLINHEGKNYKMNAPAGAAVVLNKDFLVYMTGYKQDDLNIIGSNLMPLPHFAREADLLDKEAVNKIVTEIKSIKDELKIPVYLVHNGGASNSKAKLPGDSVFSHTWDTPGESLPDLVANNCTTLLNISQEMHRQGLFADQDITKIIFITATAAIRARKLHGGDAVQKGAGHSLIRTMALDLTPERIYVTELMPGITDSGFYDNPKTLEAEIQGAQSLGYDYTQETMPVFTAEVVGEAVEYILKARGNVRELSVMPFGQFPHLGS